MQTTTCDSCGGEIRLGDWPMCNGNPEKHRPAAGVVIQDSIEGGELYYHGICNPDGSPKRYYSRSEIRQAEKERGVENVVRHVPLPGTDKSPYTTDWSKGSMDAQTLENVRVLLSRQTKSSSWGKESSPEDVLIENAVRRNLAKS